MAKNAPALPMGVKVYPLSRSQTTVFAQESMCLHKGMLQLPCILYFQRKIDPELFRKAVNTEIERNDSMRMFFSVKKENKKKVCSQYFSAPYDIGTIPYFDCRGKSRKDIENAMKPLACKPMDYYGGAPTKFAVIDYEDDKSAVLVVVNHLAMDSYGQFVLIADLFNVYACLENGSELPKAPASAEECLIKELEYTEESAEKDKEALMEYYKQVGVPNRYAAIVNEDIDIPKKFVKRAHSKAGMLRQVITWMIHDATLCYKAPISGEKLAEAYAFCEKEKIGFNTLLTLLIRNYMARINHRDDVLYYSLVNRRGTLKEKKSGGCRVGAFFDSSNIPADTTFREAAKITSDAYSFGYRHANYGALMMAQELSTAFGPAATQPGGNLMLTLLPAYSGMPEGFDADTQWVSVGHALNNLYIFTTPGIGGSLIFNYEYRTYMSCESQMAYMHQSIVKMLDIVMENPDITIRDLIANI